MKLSFVTLVPLLILALSTSAACNQKNDFTENSGPLPPISKGFSNVETIEYSNWGCMGTCSIFNVILFSDGAVLYRGLKISEKQAAEYIVRRIDPSVFKKLIEHARSHGIFAMREQYDSEDICPQMEQRADTKVLRITTRFSDKSIRYYNGCVAHADSKGLLIFFSMIEDQAAISEFLNGL